jgi:hypothetical protein
MIPRTVDRPRWSTVTVHIGPENFVLDGSIRLAALFRWLRKETPSQVAIMGPGGDPITDPLAVNWHAFPMETAIEATDAFDHLLSAALDPALTRAPRGWDAGRCSGGTVSF